MAPTVPPTPNAVPISEPALSTAAIVMIAIGGYLVIVVIALIIRQCLKNQGVSLCPAWVSESCCGCCATAEGENSCCGACLVSFAEACDCTTPSKRSCMDSICPSKQWCDENICCCLTAQPGGGLCQDCNGPECGCGDCNCACNCQIPECNSINCICFEIKLNN